MTYQKANYFFNGVLSKSFYIKAHKRNMEILIGLSERKIIFSSLKFWYYSKEADTFNC